ncbi:hypothetical protein FHS77_003293 [Paenochrobactrum gallinarii]|uniref:Uncharacterized protein n=1 Tax=Paenochrobactrum gallinarii TaxID=643673 RepID=A0A841LWD8_9HYPH|nr:hypothetical protein [Paenochrobactrum gallinarii]
MNAHDSIMQGLNDALAFAQRYYYVSDSAHDY